MKRFLSLALMSLMLFAILTPNAYASTMRWTNVANLYPAIVKNSNTYRCQVIGFSGTTNIQCDLVLYEKPSNGDPIEVARTSGSSRATQYTCKGEYNNFSTAKTYIMEITVRVTRNGYTETVKETCQA